MSTSDPVSSPVDVSGFAYVVGIEVGSEQLLYTVCQPDKRPVIKPSHLSNDREGFARLDGALRHLGVPPGRILCTPAAQRRGARRLCARRADRHLSRAGAAAPATQ